jgi:UDP-GlcNAc3NAcA epimerase
VMADVSLAFRDIAEEHSQVLEELGVEPGSYLVATAHRAGNVDRPERLQQLVDLLRAMPQPVVFPAHPRTRLRLEESGLLERLGGVRLTAPLGYLDFLKLARHARAVLTDSGGVQKEAYLLGVPCITLRDTTEWVETVEAGWNVLVDLDTERALAALERDPPAERPELYGGGHAAERVCRVLGSYTQRL